MNTVYAEVFRWGLNHRLMSYHSIEYPEQLRVPIDPRGHARALADYILDYRNGTY